MNKLVFASATILIVLAQATKPKYPAALRCGYDSSCCFGAVFFAHGFSDNGIRYDQVYSREVRSIEFNSDGSYRSGHGQIQGCEKKSLSKLEE